MKRVLNQLWIVIGAFVVAVVVSWVIYMPDATERGVWRVQGGGQILTLGRLHAEFFSETDVSCVEQFAFPAHLKLVEWAEGATIEANGDTLLLRLGNALAPLSFERIAALPDTCGPPDPNADPSQVFDALWSALNDHYPFFGLYGVDWDTRLSFTPTDTLTDEALFLRLAETMSGLDDGQIQLARPGAVYSPVEPPVWLSDPLTPALLIQTARDTVGTPLTPINLTGIEYTLLPDGIGYVLIRHLVIDTPFGTRSEQAMATAFAEAATALHSADALIIDLRYNRGGSDSVAFGIASHFTGTPVDVFTNTSATDTAPDATAAEPFTATLQPYDSAPLSQPVFVLTSDLTATAAEILTLALRELPQVTTIGTPTSGSLADAIGVTLPNGWELSVPNRPYYAIDGSLYEGVGIPPDVARPIDTDALSTGEDSLLRYAIARARSD